MIEQRWCTTDGRSWSVAIGDKTASVWLIDEEFYGARVWCIDDMPTTLSHLGEFDCIKKAKSACIEAIEAAEAILADPYDIVISEVEP
jgi:hypothetical protein